MKQSIIVLAGCVVAIAGAQPKVPIGERAGVDLTIYNQNLSLIREERTFTLSRGVGRVIVPDVPSTIDATSVHFVSLSDADAVRVLEQNYQFDLVSQQKLMEKYIGKQIEFIRFDEATKREYSVFGKLIASGYPTMTGTVAYSGGMVAEINGKIELNPTGRIVLPSVSEGLITRPQLEWIVSNSKEGNHKTELSYLAGNLSWNCNYVALLSKSDSKLDITGWVTLTNTSGTTFRNAGLKLVAGDVNIVQAQFRDMRVGKSALAEASTRAPQFTQSEMFEYKLYSLQRKTDLANNETKQIELTSAKNVNAKKVFIYDGMSDMWRWHADNYAYRAQGSFAQQSNDKVGVFVTFTNEEESGLGIALPKGKVRVYTRDTDGKEQFIGEDAIDHTPKDEELRLFLGNAFDLVGERSQKHFRSMSDGRIIEETIEIKVRNHKSESAEVMIYEHPWRWSQWHITTSNAEWEKVDHSTIKFPVTIAKDGERVVTYTIRYSW